MVALLGLDAVVYPFNFSPERRLAIDIEVFSEKQSSLYIVCLVTV